MSTTSNATVWAAAPSSTTRARASMPPTSVNFTAFERKLLRILADAERVADVGGRERVVATP